MRGKYEEGRIGAAFCRKDIPETTGEGRSQRPCSRLVILLSLVFLVFALVTGILYAVLLVLMLDAERLLRHDTVNGPDGIRAVLLSLIEGNSGHEPAVREELG